MLISCADKNKISGVAFIEKEEIEPNNSLEYSQYIDLSSSINGSFYNESDADFYCISPTNGFIMDFFISVYDIKANVSLDIFSSNDMLFSINTKDIENYKGFIELKDILFKYDSYNPFVINDIDNRFPYRSNIDIISTCDVDLSSKFVSTLMSNIMVKFESLKK